MDKCSHVPHTFLDPRTGITDSCRSVCNVKDPAKSPIDCMEKCPELHECLLTLVNEVVINAMTSSTPTTSDNHTPGDGSGHTIHVEDHVIYIAIISTLLIIVMALSTMVYLLKVKVRKLARGNRRHCGVDHIVCVPDSPTTKHLLNGTDQKKQKSQNSDVTSDLQSVQSRAPSSDLSIGGFVTDLHSKHDSSFNLRSTVYDNGAGVHSCLSGDSTRYVNLETNAHHNVHSDGCNHTVTARDSLTRSLT